MDNQFQLTPEQELERVLSQIRSYARREQLSAGQIKRMFDVGIVAKGVLDLPEQNISEPVHASSLRA